MLCFISDLHLTEEELPGSVSDEDLAEFIRGLGSLAEKSGEAITLCFVGDILELLRSPRWSTLWDNLGAAPWSGAAPNFANFADGYAETCAIEVASAIRRRHPAFEREIHRFVEDGHLVTRYVPGNHDYMVQISAKLREILIPFLGLRHDPASEFDSCFLDASASVLATHGHSYDPINWHRREDGYWAIGDAVVLRIVNKFAEDACKCLGLTLHTRLGRLVQDVENVEPLIDLPIYIRWLAETQLTIGTEKKNLLDVWKTTVENFLKIPHFQDPKGFKGKPFENLRNALRLSTNLGLSELIGKYASLFGSGGPNYRSAARELGLSQGYRYVLFGHTHAPMLVPVAQRSDELHFYVNTGCWRRVVTRIGPDVSFCPRRVAAHFLVQPVGVRSERYRLHQVCQTI